MTAVGASMTLENFGSQGLPNGFFGRKLREVYAVRGRVSARVGQLGLATPRPSPNPTWRSFEKGEEETI